MVLSGDPASVTAEEEPKDVRMDLEGQTDTTTATTATVASVPSSVQLPFSSENINPSPQTGSQNSKSNSKP
jgi:hypothetical protein